MANLSREEELMIEQFKSSRNIEQLRVVNVVKDKSGDWRAYLVEGIYQINQKDPLDRTVQSFKSNRYSTIEIRPKRLGGNAVVHEANNYQDSRRAAEDAFTNISDSIRKLETRGHL